MGWRTTAAAALVAVAGLLAVSGATIVPDPRVRADLDAVDRARQAGLAKTSKTWSASTIDKDRDGHQDLWIGYHATGGKLWRSRATGGYSRVARSAWPAVNAAGRSIDRHDCAWADVDRNHRPDAYCSTGRFIANVVKRHRDNELWLQRNRGSFREVGTAWGAGNVCGRGRHVAFLHANRDRWPDLFLGNETPRTEPDRCDRRPRSEHSKLFINARGTGFRAAPDFWDYGAGPGTQCAEVLDFNGDGHDDLLTCREDDLTPRLYRNVNGRRFADVTSRHSLDSRLTDAVVADLDDDHDPDLVTSGYAGFAYHENVAGRFQASAPIGGPQPGLGWSVAVGEADGDDDLDVYGMVGSLRSAATNPDDVILLQGDTSLGFPDELPVPSAGGAANEVITVNRRRQPRASFLVLNGFGRATGGGPIQLIEVLDR